jgi:hypothetical protein
MARPVTGGAPQHFFYTESPLEATVNVIKNTVYSVTSIASSIINNSYFPYASATLGTFFFTQAIFDGFFLKKHESNDKSSNSINEPIIHPVPKAAISALAGLGGYYYATDKSWLLHLCCVALAAASIKSIGELEYKNFILDLKARELKHEINEKNNQINMCQSLINDVLDGINGDTPST